MGKKKKDFRDEYPDELVKQSDQILSGLKSFRDYIPFIIYEGRTVKEIKHAKEKLDELIKHLERGEYDKVYDEDFLENAINEYSE